MERRSIPVQPEPGEVAQDSLHVLGATAARIEILESEHDAARAAACLRPGERERPRMAEMQAPARARREPTDRQARCVHFNFEIAFVENRMAEMAHATNGARERWARPCS